VTSERVISVAAATLKASKSEGTKKKQSRRSRQRERLNASVLSICSVVCLSVAKIKKNAIFSKTKQFRAMVSSDNLQEVVPGLFN